jgi:putative transport protein
LGDDRQVSFFVSLLKENPLLLLFLVAAIGFPLGRLRLGGASLGVAAVLFTGLAFGALDPELKLPDPIYQFGLVLFVYTIGLASGSLFFASLGRKGLRYNLLVSAGLALAAGLTVLAHLVFELPATFTAGLYAGSLTNTPALAGVLEHIQAAASPELQQQMLSEPVIAYSVAYPVGVLGMILAIYLLQRLWKVDYAAEARRLPEYNSTGEPLISRTVCITYELELNVAQLVQRHRWNVVFGRIRSETGLGVVTGQTMLRPGDLVTMIGSPDALDEVTDALGQECGEHLEFDLSRYDKRRFFISSHQAIGRRLRDLDLINRYGAVVTRIRRGDVELLPSGATVLAPGDQVRVVAPREKMEALAALLGDSYREVSEVDILTFSLGLAIGLLLGLLPIPLPGGVTLELGLAGGPLIVALVLGALGRTGPLIWTLPYGANLTLRQVGLVVFLAGIGTRAGYAFFSTISQGAGGAILLAGTLITCLTAVFTLWVGHKLLKVPFGLLIGILAGLQTQPAVLGFGLEQARNDLPNIGYAMVYPVAMIIKILLAQALLILFL